MTHELRDVASDGRLGSRPRGQLFRTYDGTAISFLSDLPIEDTGAIPSAFGMLRFPNGMAYRVEDGVVRWTRDRNGNVMEFGYLPPSLDRGPQVGLIKDALGRIVTFSYASDADPNDRITFKGYQGADRTIVTLRVALDGSQQYLRAGGERLLIAQLSHQRCLGAFARGDVDPDANHPADCIAVTDGRNDFLDHERSVA